VLFQPDISKTNRGALKARVLTALLLLALFLLALFYLPDNGWLIFIGAVILLAWDEWLRLTRLESIRARLAGAALLCVLLIAMLWIRPLVSSVVVTALCVWLVLLIATFIVNDGFLWSRTFRRLSGLIVLTLTWWMLGWLRTQWYGAWWVLGFLCIIWLADIGAYFVGRSFGKHKLAPSISPGKTIEGVFGGLLLVAMVSMVVHLIVQHYFSVLPVVWLLLSTLLVALVSVGGDLYESRLKRLEAIKDSGNILPGHGGILDRIDSALVGLPVFVFATLRLGIFSV
jgi:phosphatidate cytidylyltransferase